jgi:hypothetical protein
MTSARTPMLELYRSCYHFCEALRCADDVCETRSEMRFIIDLRWRYMKKHPRMKMTMVEHLSLTTLAIRGGWDGSPIQADNFQEITA